jgi:MoaA/NifB/PqqE/SkfB family radical SAM enzyme
MVANGCAIKGWPRVRVHKMGNLSEGITRYFRLALDEVQNVIWANLGLRLARPLFRPMQVEWLMTYECNFRCPTCTDVRRPKSKNTLVFPKIKEVIDQMSDWGVRRLGLSGGEPLMRKELLLQTLRYANSRGIYTRFVTNGFFLDREILLEYSQVGGGHIILSIDGMGEVHDSIRSKGSFDKLINTLDIIETLDLNNIIIRINTVLSNNNIDNILAVVDLCDQYGHVMWIQPYRFHPSNMFDGDIKEIPNKYPYWISNDNLPKLQVLIERLITINRTKPGLLLNDIRHLNRIYSYFALEKVHNKCMLGWQRIKVSPEGKVFWCVATIGDVRHQTLKEIWYSKEAQEERERNLQCCSPCEWGCPYQPSFSAFVKKAQVILRTFHKRRWAQ